MYFTTQEGSDQDKVAQLINLLTDKATNGLPLSGSRTMESSSPMNHLSQCSSMCSIMYLKTKRSVKVCWSFGKDYDVPLRTHSNSGHYLQEVDGTSLR